MKFRMWIFFAIAVFLAAASTMLSGRSSLWVDEIFSIAIATGHSLEQPAQNSDVQHGDFVETDRPVPAGELIHYLSPERNAGLGKRIIRAVFLSDTNPPLYYLLLGGWMLVFGTSDLAVRLFSAACTLACLPFVWSLARYLGGKVAILPACFFFALSPLTLYFSSEARMYALLWLCVLANLHGAICLHERGGKISYQVWWIGSTVTGFLTHYFFVFPWSAIVFCLLLKRGRMKRLVLIMDACLAGLLLLPWYSQIPRSLANWRVTQDWLSWRPKDFVRSRAIFRLVSQFFTGHSQSLWYAPRLATTVAFLSFVVVFIGLVWRFRQKLLVWPSAPVGLGLVAGCAGPIIFDLVQHTYTLAVPRYALSVLPLAYLMAATGLVTFELRVRAVLLVMIGLSWAASLVSIYNQTSRIGEPFDKIGQCVGNNQAPGSFVLVHSIPSGVLGVARYSPPGLQIASWVGQLHHRQVPDSIANLTRGYGGMFLVKVHAVNEAAPEEDWLRAKAERIEEKEFANASIIEFRFPQIERRAGE